MANQEYLLAAGLIGIVILVLNSNRKISDKQRAAGPGGDSPDGSANRIRNLADIDKELAAVDGRAVEWAGEALEFMKKHSKILNKAPPTEVAQELEGIVREASEIEDDLINRLRERNRVAGVLKGDSAFQKAEARLAVSFWATVETVKGQMVKWTELLRKQRALVPVKPNPLAVPFGGGQRQFVAIDARKMQLNIHQRTCHSNL